MDRSGRVRVGPRACDARDRQRTITHVEICSSRADDVVTTTLRTCDEFASELAARAGDDDAHYLADLSGSHHQRLSRYHATVASSASSSERWRFQPSAVILAMSTE